MEKLNEVFDMYFEVDEPNEVVLKQPFSLVQSIKLAMESYRPNSPLPIASEAVEFAEWIDKKQFKRIDWNGKWQGGNLSDAQTTLQLYNLFKLRFSAPEK